MYETQRYKNNMNGTDNALYMGVIMFCNNDKQNGGNMRVLIRSKEGHLIHYPSLKAAKFNYLNSHRKLSDCSYLVEIEVEKGNQMIAVFDQTDWKKEFLYQEDLRKSPLNTDTRVIGGVAMIVFWGRRYPYID